MDFRRKYRSYKIFWTLYKKWREFRTTVSEKETESRSIVIIPCAPDTIGGSRGDEAMIVATIQYYSNKYPSVPIYIVTSDIVGSDYVKQLQYDNVKSLECWKGKYPINTIYEEVINCQPKDVCILGADCMDGFYSPYISLMLLGLHDLFSKTKKIHSHLLAFSFNSSPSWMMKYAFKKVNNELNINLRDPVSLYRYKCFIGNANLLADAAFCLQAEENFDGYYMMKQWCIKQKYLERIIIAFNFHPMLRKYHTKDELEKDAKRVSRNLCNLMCKHKDIALVLVPHDDRNYISDNTMLALVYNELISAFNDRLYYDSNVYRATQLKGLCGLFDALISSRMHLAIAALGQEIPVMAATYQGKFEGLFQLFGLSEEYLMSPYDFCSDKFQNTLEKFLLENNNIKQIIKKELPKIIELSRKNFQ